MPGTADTFTSSNRLDKQPTGGNYNRWGQYLNDNFDLIDDLKDGNLILTMSTAQHTLTTNTGAADEARMASITVIGTPGGTATITAPDVEKLTWVENLVAGGYPIVWTNGTGTSCTIPNASVAQVQCDAAGNMKILGGSVFGSRRLQGIGLGTATDDAVRMDQFSVAAGRSVPTGGTANQTIVNLGTFTGTVSGTATATTSYAWGDGLLQGLESIFIPAKAFTAISTNGGTATSLMCTTSSRMIDAIAFGSATSQYASFSIEKMPKSWDRKNVDAVVRGFTTGASGTGVVAMNYGLVDIVSAATVDRAFNYSGDLLGTEAGTASYEVETGSATASVSGGTASSGAGLGVMVRRNTTSTSQSLSGNFFFTGILLRYNNSLPNDS